MIDNIFHLYKDFYYSLPRPILVFFGSIYGSIPIKLRFGKRYSEHLNFVQQFDEWDENLQLDFIYYKTLELLVFAERHIPYYKRTFGEHGFSSNQFKSLHDFNKIPLLTKEDIKRNLSSLYTFERERGTVYYTGGSTSVPMEYYLPLFESRSKERAYLNYTFSKLGYSPRDRAVSLKGRETAIPAKNIFWQYEPVDNFLALSSNYLSPSYIDTMVRAVDHFEPSFFFGFPSAVIDFIKAAKKNNLRLSSIIKAVFLTSENIFEEQLAEIREYFQCDVLTVFGHTERASFAARVNQHPYRFLSSYGCSRVVNGEIIATGFDNFVMPFINYQLNDFVTDDFECYFGTDILRSARDIEGRIQEFLVTRDYRLISITSMGAGHFSSLLDVAAIQYRQREPGKATLMIQQVENSSVDIGSIQAQLGAQTGNAIDFSVVAIEQIKKTSRGKRILCIQEIDLSVIRSLMGSVEENHLKESSSVGGVRAS